MSRMNSASRTPPMHPGSFSSSIPCDDKLSDVTSELAAMSEQIQKARMKSFTQKQTKKRKTGEAELDAPPGDSTWSSEDSSLAHGLSKLEIQLDSEECPGWTMLNHVRFIWQLICEITGTR